MNDVEKLLLKIIKPTLEELSNSGVGIYDCDEDDGIHYIFDGKSYLISAKEEEN